MAFHVMAYPPIWGHLHLEKGGWRWRMMIGRTRFSATNLFKKSHASARLAGAIEWGHRYSCFLLTAKIGTYYILTTEAEKPWRIPEEGEPWVRVCLEGKNAQNRSVLSSTLLSKIRACHHTYTHTLQHAVPE